MPAFLTAEWRHLVLLNFAIDPGALLPYLPHGVELDLWNGQALFSLVGFHFERTRLLGLPIPGHRCFAEINLRFYVVRRLGSELRRGVVFPREIVARPAVAWIARALFGEPYTVRSIRWRAESESEASSLAYHWRERGRWHGIEGTSSRPFETPAPESQAAFILEHYWGFTPAARSAVFQYEVRHPPWRARSLDRALFHGDPYIYGPAFAPALTQPPLSALEAEGSHVEVSWPERIL